jgi:hypothetical protein
MGDEAKIYESSFNYEDGDHSKLSAALDYLTTKYNKTGEIKSLLQDTIAQKALYLVAKCVNAFKSLVFGSERHAETVEFDQFLAKLIGYLSEIRHDLDFSKQEQNLDEVTEPAKDQATRQITAFRFTLYLIKELLTAASFAFLKNFCANHGLKAQLVLLGDPDFVNKNQSTTLLLWKDGQEPLIDYLAWSTAVMSQYWDQLDEHWTRSDAVNVVRATRNKLPERTFRYLSAILDDDEFNESTFNFVPVDRFKSYLPNDNLLLLPKALRYLSNKYSNANDHDMQLFFNSLIDQKAFYLAAKILNATFTHRLYPKYENAIFGRFLAKIISYLAVQRSKLDFEKQETQIEKINEPHEELAMRWTLALRFALFILGHLGESSVLCTGFCAANGLTGLLAFLGDAAFVFDNQATKLVMFGDKQVLLLSELVWRLTALGSYCKDFEIYWTQTEAVNVLKAMAGIPDVVDQGISTFRTVHTIFSSDVDTDTFNFINLYHTFNGVLFTKAIRYLTNKYNIASQEGIKYFFDNTIDQKALYFVRNYQTLPLKQEFGVYAKYEKVNFDLFLAKVFYRIFNLTINTEV